MRTTIRFHPLTENDFPLLHEWLERPHVSEWWDPTPSYQQLRADYLPLLVSPDVHPLDAPEGVVPYLAYDDGEPIAFLQAYRVVAGHAEGWWLDETDPQALGIDQFIGLPDRLGQGLGTRLIRAFTEWLFDDPRVTRIHSDPDPENARAIACYRKVGFHDVGRVETPDGVAWLMRLERPENLAPLRSPGD